MRNLILQSCTALALVLVLGSAAQAGPTISMAAQEGNGLMVAVPLYGLPGTGSYVYDDYTLNYNFLGSVTGSPTLPQPTLDTTNVSVEDLGRNGVQHTLTIWMTETGLTEPMGETSFLSGFTTNTWTGGLEDVTEEVFVSTTDATNYTGTLVGSENFTGPSSATVTESMPVTLTGPYSETVEYTIRSDGYAAAANNTIDVAVPEPMTIAVFGVALLGLGVTMRHRRRGAGSAIA